jgi:hypothetical protein
MLIDEFRIFATTELPDGSKTWVVVAVHADDPNHFVREVHIIRPSGPGGIVVATDYSGIGGGNPETAQHEFEEAEHWAHNYIAHDWVKNEDFSRRDFRLLRVNPAEVTRIKYERGLPDSFGQITNATDSTSLREWLLDLR